MNRAKVCPIGILAIILFAALGFRLLYFWAARAGPLGNIDSAEYEDLASRFTEHRAYVGGIGIGGFPSDLQRPPGYPYFLAWVRSRFGIGRTRVAVVQCVLDTLFVALLAMTGTLLVNEFAGLIDGNRLCNGLAHYYLYTVYSCRLAACRRLRSSHLPASPRRSKTVELALPRLRRLFGAGSPG